MKKDLIIIGAGSVGGFIAINFEPLSEQYNLLGFLDDDTKKIGNNIFGYPVLGDIDSIKNYDNINVIIGIAFPEIKKKIIDKIGDFKNIDFVSYVSPNSWISNKVSMGIGIIIYPNVSINYETEIKDFVTINMNCSVGHNTILSSFSTLAPNVALAGFTILKEGVEMGICSCTIQNIRIGSYSKIGGNSIIIREIPERVVAVGSPAKIIQYKD